MNRDGGRAERRRHAEVTGVAEVNELGVGLARVETNDVEGLVRARASGVNAMACSGASMARPQSQRKIEADEPAIGDELDGMR